MTLSSFTKYPCSASLSSSGRTSTNLPMHMHKSALIYETQKLHINAVAQILVAVAQYSCMDLNPNRLIPSGRRQRG